MDTELKNMNEKKSDKGDDFIIIGKQPIEVDGKSGIKMGEIAIKMGKHADKDKAIAALREQIAAMIGVSEEQVAEQSGAMLSEIYAQMTAAEGKLKDKLTTIKKPLVNLIKDSVKMNKDLDEIHKINPQAHTGAMIATLTALLIPLPFTEQMKIISHLQSELANIEDKRVRGKDV
jgi:hypothetical protein